MCDKKHCPECGEKECVPTGSGFIEQGEFIEDKGLFESEGKVTEYTCNACENKFFTW